MGLQDTFQQGCILVGGQLVRVAWLLDGVQNPYMNYSCCVQFRLRLRKLNFKSFHVKTPTLFEVAIISSLGIRYV